MLITTGHFAAKCIIYLQWFNVALFAFAASLRQNVTEQNSKTQIKSKLTHPSGIIKGNILKFSVASYVFFATCIHPH